jgi:hypothetical protein
VFVAVEIPIADLRPFVAGDTGRVPLPGWPNPQVDVEFVRSFGPVRERLRGGLDPWPGEGAYANAARAMRFPPGFAGWPRPGRYWPATLRCVYRRLYSDGRAVSRAEIGFGPQWREMPASLISAAELIEAVETCLAIPLRIPMGTSEFEAHALADAGSSLARCLLRATTTGNFEPNPGWLRAVRPMVVVTASWAELHEISKIARRVPLGDSAPPVLHRVLGLHGGRTVPVWFLPSGRGGDLDLLRRIRLHLFRLHAEREVLKWILGAASHGDLADGSDPEPWDRLQRYLNDTLGLLERGSIYGIGPTEDLRSALRLTDLVNPGERSSLLAQLEGVRGNVLRKVENASAEQHLQPILYYDDRTIFEQPKEVTMGDRIEANTDNSTNFRDINAPVGAVGTNSKVWAGTMQQINFSSASEELKATLAEVVNAVEAMTAELDSDSAEGASRDAKALIDEATSKSPRRETIERISSGLLRTAETVGKVGVPVVKTVTMLLALFG